MYSEQLKLVSIFFMIDYSEEGADCPRKHALIVGLMGLHDLLYLFLIELHCLENDSHQVDLNARVLRHEV